MATAIVVERLFLISLVGLHRFIYSMYKLAQLPLSFPHY
ncbi:hypothetical protein BTN50_0208 [Candidatus Enterovibrio altilux]|uniref:Mobile element protein n=1 Tax=Candidatus Enterovibrio altilux TaxID=1927128 RepID=A0A291B6X8_9GAMM|nr:hypothetical protein BTN50_0208 [Candidatus Enterovibrio luxaltus]